MERLQFSCIVHAPRAVVWDTMLEPDTYRIWTTPFTEGSYYDGSWRTGERVRFLSPGGMGMLAEIAECRPHEHLSIRHLGMIRDGVEDTTSEAVRAWTPAYENYAFRDVEGGTELGVEMDVRPEDQAAMKGMWNGALAVLKVLAEHRGALGASHARWVDATRGQFTAAVDMLENAIRACPDSAWGDRVDWWEFWYVASHVLYWLDYYLSGSPEHYVPPAPLGLEEADPEGKLPPRVYTKDELLAVLAATRPKLHRVLDSLDAVSAQQPSKYLRIGLPQGEMLLYNLRHVQHHTAQLQWLLRQAGTEPPRWVRRGEIRA